MTRDKLEETFDECFDKNTVPTGGGYEADFTDRRGLYNSFEPTILEYSKQECIEFADYKDRNFSPSIGGFKHRLGDFIHHGIFSNKEIYELYLKSKTTQP